MFTALTTLLASLASITLSIVANEGGTITVTLIPKQKKEGESALNTPLSLTGTPEELDTEFASIVASYSNKRLSLAEQLAATEAILEAAKKESATKATKSIAKKGAAPSTPAAKPTTSAAKAEVDNEEEDEDSETADDSTPSASAAPVKTEAAASNLWD